ncbi:MAG: ribosome small subunit-dependent GTPase A [Treponema sp.]|nr:ribosome small subunit-dependent GTPase A [Treponema sp.]
MKGRVMRGSRNIFTVKPGLSGGDFPPELECRIKGKVLKGAGKYQNPLAPGDLVFYEEDPARPGTGFITAPGERRNVLTRLNPKGLTSNRAPSPQLIAANVDLVLCVASAASPPFRPRFVDRLLLQADASGIPAAVLCNKWDLFDGDPDIEERLEDFRRIGIPVIRLSAKTGKGMDEFRDLIRNRFSVLAGQSGTGKSSLINALLPSAGIRTGGINEKYGRGNHTTTLSSAVEIKGGPGAEPGAFLVDTPGIRLFIPHGISPGDIVFHMREFAPLAGKCTYGLSCSHRKEPGCRIMEAVDAGVIHEDRYESFLRIQDELLGISFGNGRDE